MGNSSNKSAAIEIKSETPPKPAANGEKPKCKACCACPETKQVRDAWYAGRMNIYYYDRKVD